MDKPVYQTSRILGLVPGVIAARIGHSVVLYIYCKNIKELEGLNELLALGRLKDSIELLFKSLLIRSQNITVAALTVSDGEFQKMREYFKGQILFHFK